MNEPLSVYIGWDSREIAASEVAAHSIRKRTKSPVHIKYLKHKELRKSGLFTRAWMVDSSGGHFIDAIDGKPFSTEFSHTRFLVPALMNYRGWALFIDADMLFLSDIQKLAGLCNNDYAVMVVKHNHQVKDGIKMDGQKQQAYWRKNWSSFVLWNCAHESNRKLTAEYVNQALGSELHAFSWLTDEQIGALPATYNYIKGVSPALPMNANGKPDVIHYTEGGPWFDNCKHVAYADFWLEEYEDYQRNQEDSIVSHVPTMAYDREDA